MKNQRKERKLQSTERLIIDVKQKKENYYVWFTNEKWKTKQNNFYLRFLKHPNNLPILLSLSRLISYFSYFVLS